MRETRGWEVILIFTKGKNITETFFKFVMLI